MSSASPESLDQLLEIQELDKSIAALRHQKNTLAERESIANLEEESSRLQKKKDLVSEELSSKEEDQQRLVLIITDSVSQSIIKIVWE